VTGSTSGTTHVNLVLANIENEQSLPSLQEEVECGRSCLDAAHWLGLGRRRAVNGFCRGGAALGRRRARGLLVRLEARDALDERGAAAPVPGGRLGNGLPYRPGVRQVGHVRRRAHEPVVLGVVVLNVHLQQHTDIQTVFPTVFPAQTSFQLCEESGSWVGKDCLRFDGFD